LRCNFSYGKTKIYDLSEEILQNKNKSVCPKGCSVIACLKNMKIKINDSRVMV
jgi:hypothetical protein